MLDDVEPPARPDVEAAEVGLHATPERPSTGGVTR